MTERLPNGPTPQIDETPASLPDRGDVYGFIEAVANLRIEQLKALGVMLRESQILDECGQDNHFDELEKEFAYIASFFGVAWPPMNVRLES